MLVDAIYSLFYSLPLSSLKTFTDRRKYSICAFKFTSLFYTLLSIYADLRHRRLGLFLYSLLKLFLNDEDLVYKCLLNKFSCQ